MQEDYIMQCPLLSMKVGHGFDEIGYRGGTFEISEANIGGDYERKKLELNIIKEINDYQSVWKQYASRMPPYRCPQQALLYKRTGR